MEMSEQDVAWLKSYSAWIKQERRGKCPKKPSGFDLRLQGIDPMKLKGFSKKPESKWRSKAKAPKWPSEKREQTNFNL